MECEVKPGLAIPLPPLATQQELMDMVERLESFCNTLKARMTQAPSLSANIATASTASITGIRTEDKEEMKAPKTELVSRLTLGASPADKDEAPPAALLMRSKGELSAKALWQASGLEIDAFCRQLKTEMAHGWIVQPKAAYVREVAAG